MYRIFLLYALSGFVSLGYQVSWFRIFNNWFGSTTLTFALVVSCFIGGLGIGAYYSKPVGRWISQKLNLPDGLRTYGAVELAVGTTALLTLGLDLMPSSIWGDFPYSQDIEGFWRPNLSMGIFQAGAAIACVLIPCFFMGVTFPLLCHTYVGRQGAERLPSSLYAWNTLGACSGVLACQFLLIPIVGHGMTYVLMALLNLVLGAYFLCFGVTKPIPVAAAREEAESPAVPPLSNALLLAFAILSGLVAGALEGDMFKRIAFAIAATPGATMSFISFWAILGIFLASTAVRRARNIGLMAAKAAFCIALLYYVPISQLQTMDALMDWIQTWVFPVAAPNPVPFEFTGALAFPNNLTQLLVFVGFLVFPTFFFTSLLLPYVCNRAQTQGDHIGQAYGVNTVAFCAGMLSFTLIVPQINIFFSTKLFHALFVLAALSLLFLREDKPIRIWQPGMFLGMGIIAWILVPATFDKSYFTPTSGPANMKISALKSDGNHTTFIGSIYDINFLYFGRLQMTGTNMLAQAYMRLMAHFPLLAQQSPKRALLICFGVGNTASAIAAHESIEQIDVVDLNRNVFRTAPELKKWNNGVYEDPRVRLIHDDGRHFLRVASGQYDLITSEPPPPMAAGVYRLYSKDYYTDVLAHLTPTGTMSQWLPIYQMPPAAVEMAVKTFIEVFPHALLFSGFGNEFILVGSPSPIDLDQAEKNFGALAEATAADLSRAGVNSSVSLIGRIIDSDRGLRSKYAKGRVISDQHNSLEQILVIAEERQGLLYSPDELYTDLEWTDLDIGSELRKISRHLGRLRYRVNGFPFESLANVKSSKEQEIQLENVDWIRMRRIWEASIDAYSKGRSNEAISLLQKGVAIAPEQPEFLMSLASIQLATKDYPAAEENLRKLLDIEAEDLRGRYMLVIALREQNDFSGALAEYRNISRMDRNSPGPLNEMAWILATHPDSEVRDAREALQLASQAIELSPTEDPNLLDTLAAAYAANGDYEKAQETTRNAIELASAANASISEQLHQRMKLYSEQKPFIDYSLTRTNQDR